MSVQTIVIIGGGYGGFAVAQKLASKFNKSQTHQIILIERKSHFYHSVAGLRTVVEDEFENKVTIPYDHLFDKHGQGKIIHGTVTKLNKNDLIVSKNDGEEEQVTFEIAVIATGSDYPRPAKFDAENKEEGVKEIIRQREAVKGAQKILIVGGGPVGIELAGEIASVYGNEKEVTLVHGEENLLSPKFPIKLSDSLAKQLKDLNVKLILGDKIDFQKNNIGDGLSKLTITTEKGQVIESDVQFVAIGAKPNTSLIESLNSSLIDENSHLVKVKPTLQLDLNDEYNHIFAIGDITNIPETKLAFRAALHADLVSKNISSFIDNKKLEEYKPMKETMMVTIGKKGGAGLLPVFGGLVVGSMMVRNFKGKNLFVDKYWKEINPSVKL
jgi:NADH dehydrogenase FAD-containing subunit